MYNPNSYMCVCCFTVCLLYIFTSLIQRSDSATIVSIIMLVYLLYLCVSVCMYMFLYKTSLFVNCIMCMYYGWEAASYQINQIKSNQINQIKSINSKTTDTRVIIELSFNIPVKPGKKVLKKSRNS